ncbi:MAG TPA: hypothetical protein ENN74_02190 [Firmicutes bacterium]|nr:hypothetical protein [Bacillota bacterium]
MLRRNRILLKTLFIFIAVALLLSVPIPRDTRAGETTAGSPKKSIDIYEKNPAYWSYGGEPVLLLGGSAEDNLFQLPGLEAHLDLLHSVGGNYVRNTMSCRDPGDVWPFFQNEEGLYDLDRWNEEFWHRFETFLRLTAERDIIVQIELWATFDYYRDNWERNPFNPKNNITYSEEDSELPLEVKNHPSGAGNNFFWSVPAERNQAIVLKYQQRFIDKVLFHSLPYDHILYCMDNETAVTPEWGKYWAHYVQDKAAERGKRVHTTEMWNPADLSHPQHSATFDHPETYSFVDISQNNHQKGQRHWDNAQKQRLRIAERRRPLTNVKIYGADGGAFGSNRDAMERFWRNVIGGMASARFHRPERDEKAGLGLGELAQANIRSARMLTDAMDLFTCEPCNELLSEREANEAYCTAHPGREYAVYFPDGGEVVLDVRAAAGPLRIRWLNIRNSEWQEAVQGVGGGPLKLTCPTGDPWVVLIQAV